MRHNKNFNHLGRQSGHRKAMLSNMASSLILHKRIETTVAKAKALRKYVEPLVTKSKEDTTHSRRVVFGYLKDKHAVTELFRTVAPKIADRPGGYCRILKTGFRLGDAAEMCIIELVDFNETYVAGAVVETKARTRRSRGGSKKGAAEATPVVTEKEQTAEVAGSSESAVAAESVEGEKAAVKKTPAKKPTTGAKKSTVAKTAVPKVSAAKTKTVKTGISKKS